MRKQLKRKALAEVNNVEAGNAGQDDGVEARSVDLVCAAIDEEVKARACAIRAICEAQVSSAIAQLKLCESTLSTDLLNMPVEQFVRLFCPTAQLVRGHDGIVEIQRKQEPAMPLMELAVNAAAALNDQAVAKKPPPQILAADAGLDKRRSKARPSVAFASSPRVTRTRSALHGLR